MALVTADMTINEVVQKYSASMKVFNQHNVDSCCGGAQTLKAAAALSGANLDKLLADINAAVGGGK
jgi:regulator of cell morphogenesis and NO signaling